MGYRHRPKTHGDPEQVTKLLPRVHRVFGTLQTWLRGTHHGVGHPHPEVSLDEFTFRFNRRRTPLAAFQTLLGLGTLYPPTTYNQLVLWSQPDIGIWCDNRALRWRPPRSNGALPYAAHVIELTRLGREARLDVARALAEGQLRKRYAAELFRAREALDPA